MGNVFVPYRGKKPASVFINGHSLVILSHDREVLEQELDLIGADRVRTISLGKSDPEGEEAIGKIAKQVDSGVVIAPADVHLKDVLKNLEHELPWLQ